MKPLSVYGSEIIRVLSMKCLLLIYVSVFVLATHVHTRGHEYMGICISRASLSFPVIKRSTDRICSSIFIFFTHLVFSFVYYKSIK